MARRTGPTWSIEVVESAGREALSPSLAFRADGTPAIAYRSDLDLRYAHREASGWVVETVDTRGTWSEYEIPSLAFDAAGHPLISYGRTGEVAPRSTSSAPSRRIKSGSQASTTSGVSRETISGRFARSGRAFMGLPRGR